MNILLTGAAGQLGSEMIPLLSVHGKLIASDRCGPVVPVKHWEELEMSDGAKLEALLNRVRPALIVNAAAYTAVDLAETYPETAFEVNATLPGRLGHWAKKNDARVIHYSTDYVFDGTSDRPYQETDTPNPKGVYGDSKLAGELAIENSGCRHVTLRTSWVYSSRGKNFVLTMLELARKGLSLKVVDDQVGCPTWAHNLALASNAVIESWKHPVCGSGNGLFHYCDDETVSWYDFAQRIFSIAVDADLLEKAPELTPVTSSEFPQLAVRPKWSVLDTTKLGQVFDINAVSFDKSLRAVIGEIKARG